MDEKFYPEPIWCLYLTSEQIAQGAWLRVAPDEVKDYRVNPFSDDWQARYHSDATVERLKALGLPRLDVRDFGALPDSAGTDNG